MTRVPLFLPLFPSESRQSVCHNYSGEDSLTMCHHAHHPENTISRRLVLLALGLSPLAALPRLALADAAKVTLPPPGERDACPVCGMFPIKYPDWIATVLYKDGHAHHFDGAKDLFKYLLDMAKYAGGHTHGDIAAIGVTGYYATEMIDARPAYYVIGSDVLGPMGHELVPHPDMYDAVEFMKHHKGKRILRYEEITMDLLRGLDKGEFRLK
jgi:nitrous oxide reductase accessory protein NosL